MSSSPVVSASRNKKSALFLPLFCSFQRRQAINQAITLALQFRVALMRSRFGPRLYELLVQWRLTGERELAIDDIQRMWGTSYERVFDFKKRVIAYTIVRSEGRERILRPERLCWIQKNGATSDARSVQIQTQNRPETGISRPDQGSNRGNGETWRNVRASERSA